MKVQALGLFLSLLFCGIWARRVPDELIMRAENIACKLMGLALDEAGTFGTFSDILEAAGINFGLDSMTVSATTRVPLLLMPTDDVFVDLFDEEDVTAATQDHIRARDIIMTLTNMMCSASNDGKLTVGLYDAQHPNKHPGATTSTVIQIPEDMLKYPSPPSPYITSTNITMADYELKLLPTCQGGLIVPVPKEQ